MRFAYYRAAARQAGVPEMWLDDAAQEIALEAWRAGDDRPTVVYYRATDAARKYGPRTRHGRSRETVEISPWQPAPDPIDFVIAAMTVRAVLRRLTPGQRRAVGRQLVGREMSRSDVSQMGHARRRLRELLAG